MRQSLRLPFGVVVTLLVLLSACGPGSKGPARDDAAINRAPDGIFVPLSTDRFEAIAITERILAKPGTSATADEYFIREGIDYYSIGTLKDVDGPETWGAQIQLKSRELEIYNDFLDAGHDPILLSTGDRWPSCRADQSLGCFVE